MTAWLRRDLRLLALLYAMGAIAITSALYADDFVRTWVMPVSRHQGAFHAAWISGAVLGAVLGLREELLGVREFYLHRPLPAVRRVQARLLGGGGVVALWLLTAPAVHFGVEAVTGDLAGLARPAAVPEVLATATPAFSAFALAFFASTLAAPPLLRALAFAAALYGTYTAIHCATAAAGVHDLAMFTALHLVVAAGFAAASLAAPGQACDPDRPWPTPARRWRLGLVTAALALGGAQLFALAGQDQLDRRADSAPRLVVTAGGEPALARRAWDSRDGERWFRVDAEHRDLEQIDEPAHAPSHRGWSPRVMAPMFEAPRLGRSRSTSWGRERVGVDGGKVRLLTHDDGAPVVVVLARDDGGAFTADARIEHCGDATWIAQRGDDAVWRVDRRPARLVRVPLPDGDRVMFTETTRLDTRHLRGRDPATVLAMLDSRQVEAVVGEREVYELGETGLVPARAWVRQEVAPRLDRHPDRGAPGPRLERTGGSPFAPRLRLVGADDAVLLEHVLAPHTSTARLQVALACWWTIARPPLLQVASALAPATAGTSPGHPLLDALLRGGDAEWLLLPNLLLGAACAVAAWRRLGRRGADRGARKYWTAWSAVTGPLGLVAALCFETGRAWTTSTGDADAAAAPAPRITTPRSA